MLQAILTSSKRTVILTQYFKIKKAPTFTPPALFVTQTSRKYASKLDIVSNKNRPVRGDPGKVILGFVPVEWPAFFYNITGFTGFYTFCFTFGIYLISKEKFVMEHEYYGMLSTIVLWYFVSTMVGPHLAKELDRGIDEYEKGWSVGRDQETKDLKKMIKEEVEMQKSSEGQLMLVEAKRECVQLQLEAAFRERQMHVYKTVKGLVDQFTEVESIKHRHARENMAQWVTNAVKKSLTSQEEEKFLNYAINHISTLAVK